jgi:hypothetical protein
MLDATTLKALAELGVPTVVLGIILWFWGKNQTADRILQRGMSEQMVSVVKNNTEALTKLGTLSDRTCDDLAAHDKRAEGIEGTVNQVNGTVNRIEQKLDTALTRHGRE